MRALLVLCAVLVVACGGGNADKDIRTTFAAYNKALAARDYSALCHDLAPETISAMRPEAQRVSGGKAVPKDCAGVLKLVYSTVDSSPTGKQTVTSIARSAAIDKLTVKGDDATIAWHARINGKRVPETLGARKVNGSWKLLDSK